MKKVKVWIATLSLLLVMTTLVLPTQVMADPQGTTNPAPAPPAPAPVPVPPPIDWALILALLLSF